MTDTSRRGGMGLWIGIGVLAIVVLMCASIIVGMALPERFGFEVERRVGASPDAVWAALHDPSAYPMCVGHCRGVEMLEPGEAGPRWVEDLGQTDVTYEVVEAEKPARVVVEATDRVVPLSYRSETTLDAVDGGTLVTMRVDGRISRGTWHVPLFRLIIHTGGIKRGFSKYLKTIEAGVSG